MKNARIVSMSAALAAELMSNSNDPKAILKAWKTTVELFQVVKKYPPYGTVEETFSWVDADEQVGIALTAWTTNPATPSEVIEAFWRDQSLRFLRTGMWGGRFWQETAVEILALPETPEDIMQEIFTVLDAQPADSISV